MQQYFQMLMPHECTLCDFSRVHNYGLVQIVGGIKLCYIYNNYWFFTKQASMCAAKSWTVEA